MMMLLKSSKALAVNPFRLFTQELYEKFNEEIKR